MKGSAKDVKTEIMAGRISSADFIITDNEIEAFLLENSLIKEHKPKYNILLKDDKSYPFIEISMKDTYPGIYVTRNTKNEKSLYYGPYMPAEAKKVMKVIYRIFKARQCSYNIEKPIKRPCVYYDTGECSAPCVRRVTVKEYMDSIKQAKKFLSGNYREVLKNLQKQMAGYSSRKKYEKAAETRDAIKAVKNIMEEQKVIDTGDKNRDAADYIYKNNAYYFGLFKIRRGRLISGSIRVFRDMPGQENPLELFLLQHYQRSASFPKETVLREGAVDREIAARVLKQKNIKPVFRKKNGLLNMLRENILEKALDEELKQGVKQSRALENKSRVVELGKSLGMASPPKVIDAVDISHFSGKNTVGSCVVFRDGAPDKSMYRRYSIRNSVRIDDYAAIKEVVRRRYRRMTNEKKPLPDLILIDGGKGQVNAAKEELEKLDIYPEIIGLAKKEEKVFRPYESRPVPVNERARFLLQRARDEAHRFAVNYQFALANRQLKSSVFDSIKGIGEKTKNKIYREFRDTKDLASEVKKGGKRAGFLTKKQKNEIIEKFGK